MGMPTEAQAPWTSDLAWNLSSGLVFEQALAVDFATSVVDQAFHLGPRDC